MQGRIVHIDIVVPVYNEASGLTVFLDHVRGRLRSDPYQASGLLVVDGGSTDATVSLLDRSGVPWMTAPRGRSKQMNAGAAATCGDLIVFLHADTYLPADALEVARQAVAEGAIGGYFQLRVNSRRSLLRLVGKLISLRSRVTGVASGDQAIFLTRRAFNTLSGYAPLPLFEDLDLCRRLKRLGPVAALELPVLTSARRWQRSGVARTIVKMWALRLLYLCGCDPQRLAGYYEIAR